MPSWIRNSRIVEFKTGRSPSRLRPSMAWSPQLNWAGYLIWWITIIKYNLKGGGDGAGPLRLAGLQVTRDDCFQDRHDRRQGPQGADRWDDRGGRAATRRIVRAARLFAEARAAQDLRGLPALRGAAAADTRAVLSAAAARQEPGPQPDRDCEHARHPPAEFRGDAGWAGEPRPLRA